MWKAAVAIIPIAWIFFSMLRLKMPAYKAGITAFLICIGVVVLPIWRMPPAYMLQAISEGVFLGLWPIVWVIFAAIFTYNLLVASGAMDTIKKMLSGISPDRRIQALVIAFAFGGFLESTAGFGTAVAIPASILAALGFEPLFAAVICLVANTVPVAFGVVGIPVITLGKVTGLALGELTANTALQLLPLALILPVFLVVIVTGKVSGIKGVLGASIAAGVTFGAIQTVVACTIGPELSAITGSLASLAVILAWNRFFPIKKIWRFEKDSTVESTIHSGISFMEGLKAWSPYILILTLVLCTGLAPFLSFLGKPPFTISYLFYKGLHGKPLSFSFITNPGTLIILSAIIGGLLQGVKFQIMLNTAFSTIKQISGTIITVLSIVSIAKLMGYSGMISSIASCLSTLTGSLFPLVSPFLGALGTFITGSDTSSNVLFGELQKQTALQIGSDPSWIAAANASGATAGKMVSPQSIAIATSATGLTGSEGKILGRTIVYALVFVALLGILVYIVDIIK